MATAKAINLRVRPLQSVDLSFPTDGVVAAQSDIHLLGKSVKAFDRAAFCSLLSTVVAPSEEIISTGTVVTAGGKIEHTGKGGVKSVPFPASDQPFGWGRLKYDSATIRSELSEHVLFELRAEQLKAVVDKAVAQRENTWVQKFESSVYEATRAAYDRQNPNSRLARLQRLATISQHQHDRLKAAYDTDLQGNGDLLGFNDGIIKRASTTNDTSSKPVHTTGAGSETVQNWKPSDKFVVSGIGESLTRGYDYRYPGAENDAQLERAQISLLDEELAAQSATNYVCGSLVEELPLRPLRDRRYFANDLLSMDLDVKRLQVAYLDTLLVSPIDGVVTGVFRNVGDSVSAAQPVIRVENDAEILLVGTLKLPGIARIGQSVFVTTDVFDSGQSLSVSGEVVAVRGHDSEDELWDVLIRCENRDAAGTAVVPINYNFDFEKTTVDIT
jgi:hypothetical protein